MVRLPRALIALAAVLAIVFAAGCGGGADPATYVKQMNTVQASFSRSFQRAQSDSKPTNSAAANRRVLARFRTGLATAGTALRKIEPPDSVKDLHEQLVGQFSAYEAEIAKAEGQFASNNPREIVAAQTVLSTSLGTNAARINATLTQINTKLN